MRLTLLVAALVFLTSAAVEAQELTKDGLIRLKRGGMSDDEILKKVHAAGEVPRLSDDDVIELVGAGIGENVINAMLEASKDVPVGVSIENRTRIPFGIRVDERRRLLFVYPGAPPRTTRVDPGASLALGGARQRYRVAWKGWPGPQVLDSGQRVQIVARIVCCCGHVGFCIEPVKPEKEHEH